MEGVDASSSTDGATVAVTAEASSTDGNPGRRCIGERDKNTSSGVLVTPACGRTSKPVTLHTVWPNSRAAQVARGDTQQQQRVTSLGNRYHNCVTELPLASLDLVFTFLPVADLCTVLGVCRIFYRAAVESDRTAWKARCLSMWRCKQGLARIAKTWDDTEEACRLEELEVISLQQRMLREMHLGDAAVTAVSEVSDWLFRGTVAGTDSLPSDLAAENDCPVIGTPVGMHSREAHQQLQLQLLPTVQRGGYVGRSRQTSAAATTCGSESVSAPPRSEQQLWGPAVLQSTPTYDAIMSTTTSPLLHASFLTPPQRGVLATLPNVALGGHVDRKNGLYWWQMGQEQRQHCLRRQQQEEHRRRQQQQQRGDGMSPQMHDDEEEEEGEEGETNSTVVTESSHRATEHAFPCLWRAPDKSRNSTSSAHPLAIILPVALQAAETPMEQQDPLHPSEAVASEGNLDNDDDDDDDDEGDDDDDDDDDNDSNALDAKPRINPYREFEEDMVMTHSLSLMQYAQQKALQGSVKEGDEDDDKNGLSVSWKFAYYMSLRSARREKLTMQVLLEATWFVCFRDTGATHPITFRADNTIVISPAVHTPCGNSTITSNVNAAAMTPLPCQLVKGGAELVVHVFPPLRVQRRLGSTTSTVGGGGGAAAVAASNASSPQAWVRVRASTNEAALRAFLAEPDATLRRLHAEEVGRSEKREEEEENAADQDSIAATATVAANAMPKPLLDDRLCGDWGWMIQSPFVKIFSVETPVPVYVHQLRRTYAPRPP